MPPEHTARGARLVRSKGDWYKSTAEAQQMVLLYQYKTYIGVGGVEGGRHAPYLDELRGDVHEAQIGLENFRDARFLHLDHHVFTRLESGLIHLYMI